MLTILKTVILAFVWLVLPILTGCLFGLFPLGYRKRRSAYLIGSLTIWALFYGLAWIALDGKWTLTKHEGFLHSAYRFDNPVDGRYNLQMEYTGIDPDQKQGKSVYYSDCCAASDCGCQVCGEPDGRAYGGAIRDPCTTDSLANTMP